MEATGTNPPATTALSKPRLILVAGALTLAVYLSWFINWLTPLPVYYAFRKGGRWSGIATIALVIAGLACFYFFLVPLAEKLWGSSKIFEMLFVVPGVAGQARGANLAGLGAIWYFLFFALAGGLLAHFETKNYSVLRLFSQVVLFELIFVACGILSFSQGDVAGWVAEIEAVAVMGFKEFFVAPEGNEELQARVRFMQDNAKAIVGFIIPLLPAMLVNSVLFVIWLNVLTARKFFVREFPFASLGPLRRWRLPFYFVWLVIADAFLLLADQYLIRSQWLTLVALNGFVIFSFVYFLQSLAIVAFYCVRWSLSSFLRVWIYTMISLMAFVIGPFGLLFVAFGFFDSWFDFRRLTPKPKPT